MNERKMEGKENSKTSKRLFAGIVFMASLLGGQAFAISLGQGFPQAIRQSVIINEKLQQGENDVKLLAAKWETASWGFDKYLEKTDWQLFLETQASIRFSLNLNAKSLQVRYFLQTDPIGYVDSANLYQAFGNNPINYTDPMGEWVGQIHKDMSVLPVWNNANIRKLFPDQRSYEMFTMGIYMGAEWPDLPEGESGALKNAFDLKGVPPSAVLQENPNKESLTYRSHFGRLQYWHAMRYGNRSSKFTKLLMISEINKWVMAARELLQDKSSSGDERKIEFAGQLIGRAMHLIEDSYCPAHTKRNKFMRIKEFIDYSTQDKEEHEAMDVITKITRPYYNKAVIAITQFTNLIMKQGDISRELNKLLDGILELAE